MTCYEVCCRVLWLQNFISALGVVNSISRPLELFCDSLQLFLSLRTLGELRALSILM